MPSAAKTEEEIDMEITITSPIEKISEFIFDFGDGNSNINYLSDEDKNFAKTFSHAYEEGGDYTPKAIFKIGEKSYTIELNEIEITSAEDNNKPVIDLIYPTEEQILSQNTIEFEYEVEDDSPIESCNFTLWNVTYSNSVWTYSSDDLLYSKENKNLKDGDNIKIELVDFPERTYAWEVECRDNNSNKDFETGYFEVSYGGNPIISSTKDISRNYEKSGLVEELTTLTNNFIEKEDSWSKDEKEALEDLGLMQDAKYYKKRLVQIDQDLKYNVNYISDSELKTKRISELNEEITNIENNLPQRIEILDEYEYIKNGNSLDWRNIIEKYLEATNTKSASSIRSLIGGNEKLQSEISLSNNLKKIKLEYYNRNENFILVNKQISHIKGDNPSLLEIIPEKISKNANVSFITQTEEIVKGEIYEIEYSSLEDNKIIYTIRDNPIDLKEIEESDTIMFSKTAKSGGTFSSITGFIAFEDTFSTESTWMIIPLIIIIIIIMVLIVLSFIKNATKKNDPVENEIKQLLNQVRTNLQSNNTLEARENYKKIQEGYQKLEINTRGQLYPTIRKAHYAIDKRDISNLVTEYLTARNSFQKEKAIELYNKINKIYKRLNKKDQTIIFKKIK
jgi:hypothetical protein